MSITRPRCGFAAGTILVTIVLAALVAIGLTACGSSTSSGASPSASAAGPVTVTDSAGTTVTLQQPAKRIVSLAPANTEIAYAVGAGSKMVAGTTYDDYPAAAKSLPKAGDFSNPSVEKIWIKNNTAAPSGAFEKRRLRESIQRSFSLPAAVIVKPRHEVSVAKSR